MNYPQHACLLCGYEQHLVEFEQQDKCPGCYPLVKDVPLGRFFQDRNGSLCRSNGNHYEVWSHTRNKLVVGIFPTRRDSWIDDNERCQLVKSVQIDGGRVTWQLMYS